MDLSEEADRASCATYAAWMPDKGHAMPLQVLELSNVTSILARIFGKEHENTCRDFLVHVKQ